MNTAHRYYLLEALNATYPTPLYATALTRQLQRSAPDTRHADTLAAIAYETSKGRLEQLDANAGDILVRLTAVGVDHFASLPVL
jgi:hypothetical protein